MGKYKKDIVQLTLLSLKYQLAFERLAKDYYDFDKLAPQDLVDSFFALRNISQSFLYRQYLYFANEHYQVVLLVLLSAYIDCKTALPVEKEFVVDCAKSNSIQIIEEALNTLCQWGDKELISQLIGFKYQNPILQQYANIIIKDYLGE